MVGTSTSPCASCKLLRRRCAKDCIFAPYFPPADPQKFAIVHKVFGASNVAKMLLDLPAERRADAVNSLVYEANARLRDPVYGCVGAISYLQNQVSQLQMQLALAQAEIVCIGQMVGQQSPPFDSQPLDHLNGPTTPVDCLDDVVSAVDNKPLFLLQNGLLALNHHHHYDHDHHMSMKTNSFFGDIIS
ncbi:unnamed protein product [Linum tenue]|uniref:LOB domain-containing protein n=1 Tax=Linum tenue TaxID=586396 RepID=A0AAV0K468_9ROSI|nr:unnamed protein product [Linum tenue]CAI0416131.1 unnamed protein product [Linum tenue]